MAHYSVLVIAHDELFRMSKDPKLGQKLEEAMLKFSTSGGDGQIVVHHSASVMKVVSSFNADVRPRVIVAEGWHCYDTDKQKLPTYLMKYLKGQVKSLPE